MILIPWTIVCCMSETIYYSKAGYAMWKALQHWFWYLFWLVVDVWSLRIFNVVCHNDQIWLHMILLHGLCGWKIYRLYAFERAEKDMLRTEILFIIIIKVIAMAAVLVSLTLFYHYISAVLYLLAVTDV